MDEFYVLYSMLGLGKKADLKQNEIIWPIGQAVKTSPFHGGIMGSNPVWVTIKLNNNIKLVSMYMGA